MTKLCLIKRDCINPGRIVSVAWPAGGCSLRGTWIIKDDEDVSIDYCINGRIITTRLPTSTCTYPRQQPQNPTSVPVVLSLPFPTCQELPIIFSAYCPIITHCCLLPVRRYLASRLVAPGTVSASSAVAAQSIHLDEPHSPPKPPCVLQLPIHCQRQNCSPGNLVSSKVRFIYIFARVCWRGSIK